MNLEQLQDTAASIKVHVTAEGVVELTDCGYEIATAIEAQTMIELKLATLADAFLKAAECIRGRLVQEDMEDCDNPFNVHVSDYNELEEEFEKAIIEYFEGEITALLSVPVEVPVSWAETHFEIVEHIVTMRDNEESMVGKIYEAQGTGGLYELARTLTNEFEALHVNTIWGESLDWQDTVEEFLNQASDKYFAQ